MKSRKHKQVLSLIRKVLKKIGMAGSKAENLIFGTGLIESNYDYIYQWNNGVARSWFQVEPATALDNINNYLKYREKLTNTCAEAALVPKYYFSSDVTHDEVQYLLETNIAYAIIMCRLKYRRSPKKLEESVEGMAKLWKDIYNTKYGKGDPEEFIEKYKMTQK